MRYLKVLWNHEFDSEPVEMFSELDADGNEVRKVERFRNGAVGFADRYSAFGGTQLAEGPLPLLEKIAEDGQFHPSEIDLETFERAWRLATMIAAA